MKPIQAMSNFAVKHPNIYAGIVGSTHGATTGALIGGVAGGIREDETFWSGAGKGALIGAGAGAIIGIPKAHMLAKSKDMTLSELYETSFDALDSLVKNGFKGLGHDGIGLS